MSKKNCSDKVIIFDLDGTIADTFSNTVDTIHKWTSRTKHKLTKEEIKKYIRYKSPEEIIKEFNISKIELFMLLWRIRRDLKDKIKGVEPFPEIKEVLEELRKKHMIILLTSNNKENTELFLKKENIDCFFKKYYKSSLFGKDKIIKRIVETNGFDQEDVIYVGDEVRDIQACKRINCKIIAVSWGYNNKNLLQKDNPDYLISKPNQILTVLGNL